MPSAPDDRLAVPGTEPAPPAARPPDAAGRAVVVVVEDDRDTNDFIAQCLSRDHQVISAFDGRDGLEKAMRCHPTLVVSDITLPVVSGVEMIAEMRRVPALQATPILLLATRADEELMGRLLDEGAQDFLVKPFSERELVVRVRNLVVAQMACAAAESASRAKDEFLAILGHELRNPLAPIMTALQLMTMRGGAAGGERERIVIERQLRHLARLVDDLLDVSRIARGRVELKTETIELADVVIKAIELASPLLEERAHMLVVDVARGLRVAGDPTRLSQVVSNLLTNAATYTAAGGDIGVHARRVDGDVVLTVRDTGIGIAAEMLPRVFDLFVQERQALDRSRGGLGIGLAIVRGLVERHGGTVSARSDGEGKGSEFTVRLPAAEPARSDAAPREPEAARAVPRPSVGATRVLVVDDNRDGAELLAEVLAVRGYETRVAHDGPSALRIAAEFSPDIALLDIGLPVMDGYELAAHLREIPGLADLQLIAVTGYGQESDRRRSRAAGFHHHLVKPVDIDAAVAVLARPAPRAD